MIKKNTIKGIKYKKGNLMDHVPNIIIAVVCLALLIGLVVLVYKIFVNDEYKAAQKMIDVIETKISAIGDGEATKFSIQSPCKKDVEKCGWFLFAFSKDEAKKPDKCYFDSCICLCKNEETIQIYDSNKKVLHKNVYGPDGICQKSSTGICRKIDIKEIKVTSVLQGETSQVSYISMKEPLSELTLQKSKDALLISQIYIEDNMNIKYAEAQSSTI
jgi:hypothetical protein